MNWKNVYLNIVTKAKNRSRIFDEYTELHHIIPRSVFVLNSFEKIIDLNITDCESDKNLVYLCAREHFFCHVLLVKIFKDNKEAYSSMLYAFNIMSCRFKSNSRSYERLKTEYALFLSNKNREKYRGSGNPFYGKKHTEESKKIIGEGVKRSYQDPEVRERNSDSHKGKSPVNKGKPMSEEQKQKISQTKKGQKGHHCKPHSEETKKKISESLKRR